MNIRKKTIIAGALLLTGLGTYTVGSVTAQIGAPPGPPPWVTENGIVDLDKLPPCFKKVGSDGELIRDNTGRPVCIPTEELFGLPPMPENE